MSEYHISRITKKGADSAASMLAPEIVSAIKDDLPVTAFAAVNDGVAVGALGGVVNRNAFEIISVYVAPQDRRKGAGTALMKALFQLCEDMELEVRAEYTPVDEEGRTLEPFFDFLGFRQESVMFPAYSAYESGNMNFDPKKLRGSMSEIFIRDHLLLEQGALIDDRRMRTKKAAPGMDEHYIDDLMQAELYGKYGAKAEYRNVLREVLFRKDVFDGKNKATGNIWMINELGHVVKETVIKPLESLDLKTFIITDDARFVAGFGARYDLLTKIEAYETLLDLYDEEAAVVSGGENKTVARAKFAILKQIKQSYEERMKLISSPYYTALSTEYLESFMGAEGAVKLKNEGLDASLKEYIQLYRKVRGGKLTPQVIDSRYNLKLSGVRKETAGKDIGYISGKYITGVNPEGSNEEILTEIYSNHKKAEMDAFAKDDIEFLRTQEIRFASDTLGLSGNDFMAFHNDFADILTGGTFRGIKLDEKVRSKISG